MIISSREYDFEVYNGQELANPLVKYALVSTVFDIDKIRYKVVNLSLKKYTFGYIMATTKPRQPIRKPGCSEYRVFDILT